MKISLVLPAWNTGKMLPGCLDAILAIDYSRASFELIAVEDGSVDETRSVLEAYREKFKSQGIRYTILFHARNKGRIIARRDGAMKARNRLLLFVDHQCRVRPSILRDFEKRNYEPVIGSLLQDPNESLASRFFYMVRRFIYRPYFGADSADVFIDEDNFDRIPKGFSPFFCAQERFMTSLPTTDGDKVEKDTEVIKGGHLNDDTKIFRKIIARKKIWKVHDCSADYVSRSSLRDVIDHMYRRGPRFVDYYFGSTSRYRWIIYGCLAMPVAIGIWLAALVVVPFPAILTALGLMAIVMLVLCRHPKDVLALWVVGPIVAVSFTWGVYRGIGIKMNLEGKHA